eukprot:11698725-Ditylum_brightwellii.AAC.1
MKWLHEHQVFIDMMIFRSSKETTVKVGYLKGVNQEAVYHLGYQDNINDLLDKSLDDLEEDSQEEYLSIYDTNSEDAIYNIQLGTGTPHIFIRCNK